MDVRRGARAGEGPIAPLNVIPSEDAREPGKDDTVNERRNPGGRKRKSTLERVPYRSLTRRISQLFTNDGISWVEKCPTNYHTDILTGTTAKVLRYDEPLLYKRLFGHFQENLEQAEKLIIIGYKGKDEKVNEIIKLYFL